MEYYSALKRNKLLRHEKIWRNFKYIVLSERSQSIWGTLYIIPTTWHFGRGETVETINNQWLSEVIEGEINKQNTEYFYDDKIILYDRYYSGGHRLLHMLK